MAKKPSKKEKLPGSERITNVSIELFCQLYALSDDAKIFGHGQNSYLNAYGHIDTIEKLRQEIVSIIGTTNKDEQERKQRRQRIAAIELNARTSATRLLTKVNTRERVDFLLSTVFTDVGVDREHSHVIKQNKDYRAKIAAIDKYNVLRRRTEPEGKFSGTVVVQWAGDDKK